MTPDLTHDYVRRVFTEEASRAGASFSEAIGGSHTPEAVAARRSAVQRIAKETRAAVYRIAKVWGADHTTVAHCLTERASLAPYDQRTYDRLCWQYGFDLACEIVQRQDPATNADIARWRKLGREA